MALRELHPGNPSYEAQSVDIVNNSIVGLDSSEAVGKHVYITNLGKTYTVLSDYTLSPYTASQVSIVDPVSGNNVDVGSDNALKTKIIINDNAIGSTNPVPTTSQSGSSSTTLIRPNDPNAYTALDVIGTSPATNLTFSNVYPVAGAEIIINRVELRIDVSGIPAGMGAFRLHLYNSAPTALTDNVTMNIISADRDKYLGSIEIDNTVLDLGDTLYVDMKGVNFQCTLASGSTTLYGCLQVVTGYTPTASCVKVIRLHVLGV